MAPVLALLPAEEDYRHGWALLQLSLASKLSGHHDEAVTLAVRALDIARRIGDEFVLAYALQERGWLAFDEGRHADATRDMRDMLATCARIRHGTGVGTANEAIGTIAAVDGRYDEAIPAFDAAIAQFDRLHDSVRAGQSRLHRADALASTGRLSAARTEWAEAERLIGSATPPDVPGLRERLRDRLAGTPAAPPVTPAAGTGSAGPAAPLGNGSAR
jgi:tetratricopeptide (TPR) repeat protein